MAATLIDDLLGQLDRFTKLAQERESENITGQDPDSMPGAENDKPIPEGATKDDPKVKDDTINNTDARNLDGAKPGSDAPVVEKGLEASESVLNPDKKPLDTADANAKEASDLGNNLIKTILETKQAAQKQAEQKQTEQKKEEKQAAAPAAKTTEAQTQKQAAPADKISVDMAMLAKIAAITLADEEGQLAIQSALTKRAGAEFAAEVLDTLEKRAAEAEFEKGAQDAEAMIGDAQEAQGAADAEEALGAAEEAQGAADAEAALADAGAAGDELGEEASLDDFSPEEVAEAVQEMAQDGQISPEDAQAVIEAVQAQAGEEGGADDLSEEELAEQLQAAVDNGQLTEEDLQNVIQELSEGGADEGAVNELAGDVGAEGGDAGVDPTEAEEPADEGEKAASAKKASAKKASAINPLVGKLIEAIKAAK